MTRFDYNRANRIRGEIVETAMRGRTMAITDEMFGLAFEPDDYSIEARMRDCFLLRPVEKQSEVLEHFCRQNFVKHWTDGRVHYFKFTTEPVEVWS